MKASRLTLMVSSLALVFLPKLAHAGVLLEPSLGYALGVNTATFGTTGTASFDGKTITQNSSGVELGMRVGYALPIIFGGIDLAYGPGRSASYADTSGLSITAPSSIDTTDVFATVGAKILVMRAYAGYGLYNSATSHGANGGPDLTSKASSAFKAGLSFTGIPLFDLNIEYVARSYSTVASATGDKQVGGGEFYSSFNSNQLLVSISLPLEL